MRTNKNIVYPLNDAREIAASVTIFGDRVRLVAWLVENDRIVDLLRRDYGYMGPVQLAEDAGQFANEFAALIGVELVPPQMASELVASFESKSPQEVQDILLVGDRQGVEIGDHGIGLAARRRMK
jgi:hypothetical protein